MFPYNRVFLLPEDLLTWHGIGFRFSIFCQGQSLYNYLQPAEEELLRYVYKKKQHEYPL